MRSTPVAVLAAILLPACGCGDRTHLPDRRTPAPRPKLQPQPTASWDHAGLVGNVVPALVVPAPGTAVLARWQLPDRFTYREATVREADKRYCEVKYRDGSRARLPTRAVLVDRGLRAGDLVIYGRIPYILVSLSADDALVHPVDAPTRKSKIPRDQISVLLRTDHNLAPWRDASHNKPGDRVLAKWDERAWWIGTVVARQGEAIAVRYDDGTKKWMPANHAIALSRLQPGMSVVGINKRDGQPMPGNLIRLEGSRATIGFFDGAVRTLPEKRVAAYVDQLGLDYGDPCKRLGNDARPAAKTMRTWLTKQPHFYTRPAPASVATSLVQLELGFALYLPSDRNPRADWLSLMRLLASQVRWFLETELRGVSVTTVIHPRPVVSKHPLAWLQRNLRESDSWHVWQPSGDSVRAVFPDGAKAGRHRVVIVIPDAPGISADSSGVERGMGFVRARGRYFAELDEHGLYAVSKNRVKHTYFDQWRENYLATTLAHEVLHTIGLPHTDGDPWSVMNIGPWYPITRAEVHVAQHHKLILHSPFVSPALSQGFAHYLMSPRAGYLRVIAQRKRLDVSTALRYGGGPGHFRLREILGAFDRGRRLYRGLRVNTGERAIVRAYLAALVQFVVDVYGTRVLHGLFATSSNDVADALARGAGVTAAVLEAKWHAWLDAHTRAAPTGSQL